MSHRSNLRPRLRAANIFLVILLLLGGLASQTSMASAQAPTGRFEPGPCDFGLQTGFTEGKQLQCGWLIVPEEHANPQGGEIRLAVAIIKSQVDNPAPDPLVMMQGGPGGSTLYAYLNLIPLDPRLRSLDRDIVLFDQRGTRYSQPSLFCQEVYDLSIELLDVDIQRDEAGRRYSAALDACHDRLVREGLHLSAYNSLENAADVEALRTALGYEQINLYGVSYGSLLALHVLRNYPQGLRSVIIDSVVPPQTNFLTQAPQTINHSLEKIFSDCAADARCSAAYPDLKEVFYSQVDRLNEHKEPIQVFDLESGKTYPALLDGDTLIGMVTQMLYQTDILPLIPRVIYEVRAGNYGFVEKLISLITFDKSMNYAMYYSVLCTEDADYTPADVDLSGLPPQMQVMQESDAEEFLKSCADWAVKPLPASIDDPVTSDKPVLVLSGAYDPVTPPEYGAEAASTLSNSYSFVFPVGGHGALTSGECQDSIVLQFLDDPTQKPDDACVAQQQMTFSTPGAIVPVPVLLDLLSLRGPIAVQVGLYAAALFFLLSALLVYPAVWVVRKLRTPSRAVTPEYTGAVVEEGLSPVTRPAARAAPRPLLYRLAPWMAALAGIALLVFIIVLFATALQMALANDSRIYIGLPGSARPLFILPLLALVLALLMLAAAVLAWARRAGSVYGRIYLSLLSLAAIACLVILAVWRVLLAVFAG